MNVIAYLRLWLVGVLAFGACCSPAFAAVEVVFYSKEFGTSFPHAFVTMQGSLDATGDRVDASYGFTAKSVSPAILMGSVAGKIVASSPSYIAKSDKHFSLQLTDEEYRRLIATIDRWQNFEQPSYNLNRRNCVFFVADLASALGMNAPTPRELMKKPRSYLEFLVRTNQNWLAERAVFVRDDTRVDMQRRVAR